VGVEGLHGDDHGMARAAARKMRGGFSSYEILTCSRPAHNGASNRSMKNYAISSAGYYGKCTSVGKSLGRRARSLPLGNESIDAGARPRAGCRVWLGSTSGKSTMAWYVLCNFFRTHLTRYGYQFLGSTRGTSNLASSNSSDPSLCHPLGAR